jgi:hypothetical protein
MADDDWLTLATLLEPSRPRPPANKRPKVPNHASVYGSGAVMGTGFISTIHSHRPHCTGLSWEKVDSPPAGGTQIINRNLVRTQEGFTRVGKGAVQCLASARRSPPWRAGP